MSPVSDGDLWGAYRASQDSRLRDQIVDKHIVLVKLVAGQVASRLPSHLRLDDLVSAGLLGFLRAIEDFDPARGVEFSAYATRRIRGAIFDELRRLDWLPRGVRHRLRAVERAVETLTVALDREPTEAEVAEAVGIDVDRYRRILAGAVTMLSLDAWAAEDDGDAAPETVEDRASPSPFLALAQKERRAMLARLIQRLPDKERHVLSLYYVEELTMHEIGRVLGVTESRVSQLHSSAVLHLRVALRRERLGMAELDLSSATGRPGRS